jgi:hypothetical protein
MISIESRMITSRMIWIQSSHRDKLAYQEEYRMMARYDLPMHTIESLRSTSDHSYVSVSADIESTIADRIIDG